MKTLIIAEKPSAGRDIARVLGINDDKKTYMENEKYIVTWALGHLVTLQDPEDIDSRYKSWEVSLLPLPLPTGLKVIDSSRGQFSIIKKLIQREDVECLINAGDAGREGLLIQEWIYRLAGNQHPVKILWASSLTDDAIKNAMNHLHDSKEPEFRDLLREAETRAVADQVYGYNYTRLLTSLYANKGTVLSYGRCQTPLLNLIVKRDMEYENFKSEPYWTLSVAFDKGFSGVETDENGKPKKYMIKNDALKAQKECEGKEGIIESFQTENKSEKAPALLNLAELQNRMGKKFGFTPDYTLDLAQKLYETYKIMSYPRTDSRFLSTDLYGEIQDHLQSCNFGKFSPYIDKIDFSEYEMDKAYFNNNKVSDHHALIPTVNKDIEKIYDTLSVDLQRCFDEIVISLIAIFYPSYKYMTTTVTSRVGERIFCSSGKTIKNQGFRCVYELFNASNSEENGNDPIIPALPKKTLLKIENTELKEWKTKPPARYNPGNIIKLMSKYKIGTSATSANIIQTLINRKFVKLENKKYISTPMGRAFLNYIPDPLKSKDMTIRFENNLQMVNSGELKREEFLENILTEIRENIALFMDSQKEKLGDSDSLGKCPKCGREIRSGKKNWYCSGYNMDPKCDFTMWKEICGKKISDTDAQKLIQGERTSKIKGMKSKAGKTFDAYLILKQDNTIGFEFPTSKGKGVKKNGR